MELDATILKERASFTLGRLELVTLEDVDQSPGQKDCVWICLHLGNQFVGFQLGRRPKPRTTTWAAGVQNFRYRHGSVLKYTKRSALRNALRIPGTLVSSRNLEFLEDP